MSQSLNTNELCELERAVTRLIAVTQTLDILVQTREWGMTDEFCDAFPYNCSLDEWLASAQIWLATIAKRRAVSLSADRVIS
jgi:hypothetical protein